MKGDNSESEVPRGQIPGLCCPYLHGCGISLVNVVCMEVIPLLCLYIPNPICSPSYICLYISNPTMGEGGFSIVVCRALTGGCGSGLDGASIQ